MSSIFIGFRLNTKKDADILQALENYVDRTKEIKKLLRIGIAVTQGAYLAPGKSIPSEPEVKIKIESPESTVPLVKTPKPKTQKKKQQKPAISKEDLVANILDGFE